MTFVILLVFGGLLGSQLSDRLTRDWNTETAEAANTLVSQVGIGSGPSGWSIRGVNIDDFAAAQHAHVRILSWTGTRIDDTAGAPDLGITQLGSRTVAGQRVETRYLRVDPVGYAILQYSRPIKSLHAQIVGIWLLIALCVLGGSALALLAGMAISRQAMRPVANLTSAAKRIRESGELDEAIPIPDSQDEIHDLAVTLAGAVETLDEARRTSDAGYERQRRFVADASHELRTPLTSLITRLEMLEADTSGEAREDAEAALRSARRMADLVADLLTLAKSGEAEGGRTEVPAEELVSAAVADAASVLEGHEVFVSCDTTTLNVDRAAVSRAIRNLLENAGRHGPPGGAITLTASALPDGSGWECTVLDEGEGIPPEIRERVFERFVRAGGDSAGSTGLGLAIVAAVAADHGGSALVREDSAESAVTIALPREVLV